jgi:hypothetical protein
MKMGRLGLCLCQHCLGDNKFSMHYEEGVDKSTTTNGNTIYVEKGQVRCMRRRRSLSGYVDEDNKSYVEGQELGLGLCQLCSKYVCLFLQKRFVYDRGGAFIDLHVASSIENGPRHAVTTNRTKGNDDDEDSIMTRMSGQKSLST